MKSRLCYHPLHRSSHRRSDGRSHQQSHPRKSIRRAFTLLEILLTLAMSVVLMILVGGAIQFYTRNMNVREMDIRQTQLATAVMQMIEDDLRATLHSEPFDLSGLELILQASGGTGAIDDDAADDGTDLSAAGIDTPVDDDPTEPADVTTLDLTIGAAVMATPGLIGNQTQIQVDLSRLPRLEEYLRMLDPDATNIDDIPSDLKTVAYFVQPPGTIGGVEDPLSSMIADPNLAESLLIADGDSGGGSGGDSGGGSGGLVRRSLDRAATTQAASTGALTLLNQTGELLAPEVLAIEFEYWDGTLWQLQWSSDDMGELPMAVKVVLTMADPTIMAEDGSGPDTSATRTFTHVVRLPLAQPVDTSVDAGLDDANVDDAGAETDTGTEAGTETSSGTGSEGAR